MRELVRRKRCWLGDQTHALFCEAQGNATGICFFTTWPTVAVRRAWDNQNVAPTRSGIYQERYGFWRPIIARAVERFLDCGDLKKGFARVRCSKCRHESFVAFSCRGLCVCPSCHQKQALEKAVWVAQEVSAQVAGTPPVDVGHTCLPGTFKLAVRGNIRRSTPRLAVAHLIGFQAFLIALFHLRGLSWRDDQKPNAYQSPWKRVGQSLIQSKKPISSSSLRKVVF